MDSFFTWDEKKAESNLKKHGVSFEEAMTVFLDPLAYAFEDESHSVGERREIIIGYSGAFRLVVVSFTQRGDIFRIITARLEAQLKSLNRGERGGRGEGFFVFCS